MNNEKVCKGANFIQKLGESINLVLLSSSNSRASFLRSQYLVFHSTEDGSEGLSQEPCEGATLVSKAATKPGFGSLIVLRVGKNWSSTPPAKFSVVSIEGGDIISPATLELKVPAHAFMLKEEASVTKVALNHLICLSDVCDVH